MHTHTSCICIFACAALGNLAGEAVRIELLLVLSLVWWVASPTHSGRDMFGSNTW